MGSGITTSFSENMTENDLKTLCGTHYKPNLFHTLRNPSTNYVSKDFFLHLTSNISNSPSLHGPSYGHLEQEIYYLYLEFSSNGTPGEMDLKTFLKFCRETKTLKKHLFSSGEAELIFQKYKTKYQIKKFINFYIFRLDLLPAIAIKRQCDLGDYMKRLALCKGPTTTGGGSGLSTIPIPSEAATPRGGQRGPVSLFGASDEQIKAVIKLQNFHRSTQAKIDLAALREVSSSSFSSSFSHFLLPCSSNN
jgi:hypothetical protein